MKPLNKMSNVEKGKLLFELYHEEKPLLIDFIKDFTQSIITDPGKLKVKPIDQIHTTDFWQGLVDNAKGKLDLYGNRLAKRSRLFSDQLFDGDNAIYACYCLNEYIRTDNYTNRKFRYAVLLLFFNWKQRHLTSRPLRGGSLHLLL